MTYKSPVYKTAIHEAGHLVVAFTLGVKVYAAVLRTDVANESLGYIVKKTQADPEDADIEYDIALTLAGNIAQSLYLDARYGRVVDGDFRRAIKLLMDIYYYDDEYSCLTPIQRRQFIRTELKFRELVVKNYLRKREVQAHVRYIAKHLMQRKRLNGVQLSLLNKQLKIKGQYSFRAKVASLSAI